MLLLMIHRENAVQEKARMRNQQDLLRPPLLQMLPQLQIQQNQVVGSAKTPQMKEVAETFLRRMALTNRLQLRGKEEERRKAISMAEEKESGLCLKAEDLLLLAGQGLGSMLMVEDETRQFGFCP